MSSAILNFDDGRVVLAGEELPGLLVRLTVGGEVRFDESKADGLSGKKRTPLGWEDAAVSLDLDLLTDDDGSCYDKLSRLERLFKGSGSHAAPKVLSVVNRHLRARGVSRVVFSGLSSRETNTDDTILASLTFKEHVPPVVKREERALKANTPADGAGGPAAPASNPKTISIDLDGGNG